MSNEIESRTKVFPSMKSPGPDNLTAEFSLSVNEEWLTIFLKILKKSKRRESSKTHSTKPTFF